MLALAAPFPADPNPNPDQTPTQRLYASEGGDLKGRTRGLTRGKSLRVNQRSKREGHDQEGRECGHPEGGALAPQAVAPLEKGGGILLLPLQQLLLLLPLLLPPPFYTLPFQAFTSP